MHLRRLAIAAIGVALTGLATKAASDCVPAPARNAGYRLETFSSDFTTSTLDTGATYRSGFNWYLMNFWGMPPMAPSGYRLNRSGSITLTGRTGYQNGGGLNQLSTAGNLDGSNWVGTAFGGGFYAEATFKFNPALVNTANGWPAFWADAVENAMDLEAGLQWPGQPPGYNQFAETDFFEYYPHPGEPQNDYTMTMHDWYGIWNQTCPGGWCDANTNDSDVRTAPPDTDWMLYHRVGFLWVASKNGVPGYVQSYFDRVPVGPQVEWSPFTGQPPPPGSGVDWTFGITDQDHFVLFLDTGLNQNFTIRSVKVWQASSAGNIVQ